MKLWLDLDGVLYDFRGRILQLFGHSFEEFPSSQAAWDAIANHPHLYRNLNKLPDADLLVSEVERLSKIYGYEVGVLTAVPRLTTMPSAEQDKRECIREDYPELLKNFKIGPYSVNKQKYCQPGDILIDDNDKNILQWRARGGIGILHTSTDSSLRQLKAYLAELD